jgi:hypothetical protein
LQQQIRTDPYNLRVSAARVSAVGVSTTQQQSFNRVSEFQQHEFQPCEFQQPQSFSNTLIEALWFRFETWFVVLVFLRAIIPVRGALVSSDVIDEELILKSRKFCVLCVIVFLIIFRCMQELFISAIVIRSDLIA